MLQISPSTKAVCQNLNHFTFDVSDRPSFSFSPCFVNEIHTNIANNLPQCHSSRRPKTARQKVNIYKWTNMIAMCAMLQINDVIKGTDETTETIMKSNAGKSKIFNDFVTSQDQN